MSAAELLHIVQIGDVSLHMHIMDWHGLKYGARGKAESMLDSYRVAAPNAPFLSEIKSYSVQVAIYADCGMSKTQIAHSLNGLLGRVTDFIAVETIDCRPDIAGGCCPCCNTAVRWLWLHTMGRVTDVEFESEDFLTYQCTLEFELYAYWKPLNQVIWYVGPRDEAAPWQNNVASQTLPVTRSMICPTPLPEDFYQMDRILSWQKRNYEATGWFYDPDYWMPLVEAENEDMAIPRRRFGTDWISAPKVYSVYMQKDRWTAPAQSIYVFKNLVGETQVKIQVDRENDVWYLAREVVTVEIADLNTLLSANGYTLENTDVLVLGDVQNMPGFLLRDGVPLIYVGSIVERTGGAWCGQVTPGLNRVLLAGGTFAQHHVFRRL